MRILYTKILKLVSDINEYKLFPYRIYNRGIDYYYNGKVSNVELVNDSLITANVKGTKLYKVEIEATEKNTLSFDCECEYDGYCKHIAAVHQYLKENSDRIDIEYLLKNPAEDKYNMVVLLFNALNDIRDKNIRFIDKDKELDLSISISKSIIENTILLINNSNKEQIFDLYFKVLSKFDIENSKVYLEEDVQKLYKVFHSLIKHPSKEFLLAWKSFLKDIDLDLIFNHIFTSIESIDNEIEAKNATEFLEYTLELLKNNNFMYEDSSDHYNLKEVYSSKIITLILRLLKQFKSEEDFFNYFEKMAVNNEIVEIQYLIVLIDNNSYDEITKYVEKNKRVFSTAQIIYNGIRLMKNLITAFEYKKQVVRIFTQNPLFINFEYIHKFSSMIIFDEIKLNLLNIVKKQDKYNYYEIEIYLDPNNGYELIKEAGILEFNKHVDHYLETRETDVIIYYQEQLSDYFKKVKGMGAKFNNIMEAVEKLAKMKNGKYFVFSIYRMAKEGIGMYQTTPALDYLYYYIERLDL